MTSKVQIIGPLTDKTWGRDSATFGEQKKKERNGETPLRTGKYFERIIKDMICIGYEEFCRSRRSVDQGDQQIKRPKAEVDNTLRDLQNSSYRTQPHSTIDKYMELLQPKKIQESYV